MAHLIESMSTIELKDYAWELATGQIVPVRSLEEVASLDTITDLKTALDRFRAAINALDSDPEKTHALFQVISDQYRPIREQLVEELGADFIEQRAAKVIFEVFGEEFGLVLLSMLVDYGVISRIPAATDPDEVPTEIDGEDEHGGIGDETALAS